MELMEYKGSFEHYLCEKATRNNTPINAILELTPLCNMNCDMCFVRLSPKELEAQGRLCTLEEWMNVANDMKRAGTLFVLLTGGEPLLYPKFRELYLYLKKLGMIITINTNGTLINKEWAEFFKENMPRRINITLYGKDAKTYAKLCHYREGFEKTIRAIRLLKERNIDVKINGSITSANKEDSIMLMKIAQELEAPCKLDTYMYPASRERERAFDENARLSPESAAKIRVEIIKQKYQNFEEMANDFILKSKNEVKNESMGVSCRAGRSSFAINWQGKMRPCIMVTQPEMSVFSYGFLSAWDYINEKTVKIRLSSKCNQCTLREVCQTCAACALLETGSYKGTPDYMCRYTKETLRLLQEIAEEKREEE